MRARKGESESEWVRLTKCKCVMKKKRKEGEKARSQEERKIRSKDSTINYVHTTNCPCLNIGEVSKLPSIESVTTESVCPCSNNNK